MGQPEPAAGYGRCVDSCLRGRRPWLRPCRFDLVCTFFSFVFCPMSGSGVQEPAYLPTESGLRHVRYWCASGQRIGLRRCYAMSGTDVVCGATRDADPKRVLWDDVLSTLCRKCSEQGDKSEVSSPLVALLG
eukprot:1472200-Rhodomonas_salina.4